MMTALLFVSRENHAQPSKNGEKKPQLLWHSWVLLQFWNFGQSALFLPGNRNSSWGKSVNLLTWKGPNSLLCLFYLQSPWECFCATQPCQRYNAQHIFSWCNAGGRSPFLHGQHENCANSVFSLLRYLHSLKKFRLYFTIREQRQANGCCQHMSGSVLHQAWEQALLMDFGWDPVCYKHLNYKTDGSE